MTAILTNMPGEPCGAEKFTLMIRVEGFGTGTVRYINGSYVFELERGKQPIG